MMSKEHDEETKDTIKNIINPVGYGTVNTRENEANPQAVVITDVFWYRWYILAVFSGFGFVQSAIWNTWGPISESALCALDFRNAEIDVISNWGQIIMFITLFPFVWFVNNKGLRPAMLLSTFSMTFGCGLRCLPLPDHVFKYFAHAGQIFNSIAGPVTAMCPPFVSNKWFPPSERITATSIGVMLNSIGSGVSFLIGPGIVAEPPPNSTNATSCNISSEEKKEIRHDIMVLMYVMFAMAAFIFLCTLLYFPNAPPLPPSVSASMGRLNLKEGFLSLRKNYNYIKYNVALSLSIGVCTAFLGVFDTILSPLGVSQVTAGNIGFATLIAGCVAGIFVGWIGDRFRGHSRIIIIPLSFLSLLASIYFMIISNNLSNTKGFQFTTVGVWVSIVTLGVTLNGSLVVGYELLAESAYPTGEVIALGISVFLTSFVSFMLLLILGISADNSYATYIVFGTMLLSFVLICFTKEPRNRLQLDNDKAVNHGGENDESSSLLHHVEEE